ncbi:MAG: hypothetical protein ACE5OO_01105 [Candidatus Bathyarchaeia archaeon]
MSLELSGQDWDYTNSLEDSAPSFPGDAGPDQEYDVILSDEGWSFTNSMEDSPPSFPEDAGADQEYDVILWEYGWMFKISRWQRFIETEDMHQIKLSEERDQTVYGSHKKLIVLKVRERG